jgi:DNA-binding LacI/PurR family transcriptional regulator
MAISVLRTLFDLGVSVPSEVAVMGLSNIEISKYSNPPLTTIALPINDMGRVAARILFDRIEGDDTPAKTVTLSAEVLKRSST